jgi:hypothetical protein
MSCFPGQGKTEEMHGSHCCNAQEYLLRPTSLLSFGFIPESGDFSEWETRFGGAFLSAFSRQGVLYLHRISYFHHPLVNSIKAP